MKGKEDQTKKIDNNSGNEETKSQDKSSVQKVQRMENLKEQNRYQLKLLEKQAKHGFHIKYRDDEENTPKKVHTEDENDLQIIRYIETQVGKGNIQKEIVEKLSPTFYKGYLTQSGRLTDDLKFYAHCIMYLDKSDSNVNNAMYESTKNSILSTSKYSSDLLKTLSYSMFINRADEYEDYQEKLDILILSFTTVYSVFLNESINNKQLYVESPSLLKNTLIKYVEKASDAEMAEEVISFIEQYV
ncbi:hypothetical protein PPERSA_00312 [Pseudocohnilembus persalinus]|uniref:Uncharacterized protein n=1 Tax=Pseudocohnilembus persalinus TaxID=266149 RepID=A0A0V0Q9J3_PSEPJ|nr:hypothetical protein PPERSA_00312 [Pseudocohnilembus persalinus]|eukprot:KRW98724.1 hypothetical protein PPERSA_00312 [Pseudocohnilembus persalinus]